MRACFGLLVAVLCGVAGCGGDDDVAPGTARKATRDIGSTGGVVELENGGKVEIPEGALDRTITIVVEEVTNPRPFADDQLLEAAGKAYAFKPHGLQFAAPVVIELPFEGDATEVRPLKLDDDEDTTWQTVVGSEKVNSKLRISTTSFSVYRPARPRRVSGSIVLPDGAVVPNDAGIPDATLVIDAGPDAMLMIDAGAEVIFIDPAIEAYVRNWIGRPTGSIFEADVASINSIDIFGTNVTSLSGLESCINLSSLQLDTSTVTDLSPLRGLINLEVLTLVASPNLSGSLSDLSQLTNLRTLVVWGTGITGDLASLSGLTQLVELAMWSTPIGGDITGLSTLTNLQTFSAFGTAVTGDISALTPLTQLETLQIENTTLTGDIASLAAPGLRVLMGNDNITGNLSAVTALGNLSELRLNGAGITGNIGALSGLVALTNLDLQTSGVTGNLASLAALTQLDILRLNNTAITGDIAALSGLPLLRDLSADATAVSGNISALSGMTSLEYFTLDSPMVSGNVSSLSGLTNLVAFSLTDAPVNGDFGAFVALTRLSAMDLSSTAITMDLTPLVTNISSHVIGSVNATGNAIDCTGQSANIQALRTAGTTIDTDCP